MKSMVRNITFFLELLRLVLRGEGGLARQKLLDKYANILRRYYSWRGHTGVQIIEEDWDFLIILDACRYDDFALLNDIPGKLEKRISQGSSTSDWLRRNFKHYYQDIIYISSNPRCSDHNIDGFRGTDHFYKIESVWKDGWDNDLDTVPPQAVTEGTIKMRQIHPDKRMIIHYIQPHGPWIGKTRIKLDNYKDDVAIQVNDRERWVLDIMAWNLVSQGKLDPQLLRQATRDNLTLVLEDVKELLSHLDGKIVITADHGEAFGEKGVFSHPSFVYTKELVEVPWLVIEKTPIDWTTIRENRKEVSLPPSGSEVMAGITHEDEQELEKRLQALGYLE